MIARPCSLETLMARMAFLAAFAVAAYFSSAHFAY